MTVRIITKYGDLLKEYYDNGNVGFPQVGDYIMANGDKYKVMNRTLDIDNYCAVIEAWKIVEEDDGLSV